MSALDMLLYNEYDKLNSATKYPSIHTLHEMGERGRLQPTLTMNKGFEKNEKYYITEKIDGTNSRIIIYNGDYIIGSRENLLYAKGDRIKSDIHGIVKTLIPIAEHITNNVDTKCLHVWYFETYGGRIQKASSNYTSSDTYACRLFDIATIPINVFHMNINHISTWRTQRDHFLNYTYVIRNSQKYGIPMVPVSKQYISFSDDVESVYDYLSGLDRTQAGIDAHGKPEGVVIRSLDNSFIRKLRWEDYHKTMKYITAGRQS